MSGGAWCSQYRSIEHKKRHRICLSKVATAFVCSVRDKKSKLAIKAIPVPRDHFSLCCATYFFAAKNKYIPTYYTLQFIKWIFIWQKLAYFEMLSIGQLLFLLQTSSQSGIMRLFLEAIFAFYKIANMKACSSQNWPEDLSFN